MNKKPPTLPVFPCPGCHRAELFVFLAGKGEFVLKCWYCKRTYHARLSLHQLRIEELEDYKWGRQVSPMKQVKYNSKGETIDE